MFMYVRDELDVFEGELENYIASMNETGTLTPVILQVKELMNVSKGKTIPLPLLRKLERLIIGGGCMPGIIIAGVLLLTAQGDCVWRKVGYNGSMPPWVTRRPVRSGSRPFC